MVVVVGGGRAPARLEPRHGRPPWPRLQPGDGRERLAMRLSAEKRHLERDQPLATRLELHRERTGLRELLGHEPPQRRDGQPRERGRGGEHQ